MITGFNTDVEHDGVVYHVQTEDKGLDSPLILSLVYSGGAILASKRSRYEDLIAAGFNEAELAQRLKRQHRLICAAINAGRIEDLKRMGERGESVEAEVSSPAVAAPVEEPTVESEAAEETTISTEQPVEVELPKVVRPESPYTIHDSRRMSPLGEKSAPDSPLLVSLVDERPFKAGHAVTINILVQRRLSGRVEPMDHASVSVKILGTAFRPQLYSVTTNRHGLANIPAEIPRFNSGRAAVIIRVDAAGASFETRRVIHPAS
ncbi:MAG TPA: hypothetical protein VHR36_12300 [Pyrinomonadaceae bacterium]|nr:hypothetical protein [Pyrinomonadaceae bacterium]